MTINKMLIIEWILNGKMNEMFSCYYIRFDDINLN